MAPQNNSAASQQTRILQRFLIGKTLADLLTPNKKPEAAATVSGQSETSILTIKITFQLHPIKEIFEEGRYD